jgi:hypothetical protein
VGLRVFAYSVNDELQHETDHLDATRWAAARADRTSTP